MKYRPHRRMLDESMAEMVEVADRAALLKHLNDSFEDWCHIVLQDEDIRVEPYGYDERINWDTHIVTMRNKQTPSGHWYFGSMKPDYFGAIGFTDGPV